MTKRVFPLVAAAFIFAQTAMAQDVTFIQIEAQPSLARAEQRVRDYAGALTNVNGFSLGAGWYGIALGPYSRGDAEALLRQLRAEGRIPSDSYVAGSDEYQSQFWPIGASIATPATPAPLPVPAPAPAPAAQTQQTLPVAAPTPAPAPAPAPVPVIDETPREARASEARLSRDERKDLQVALKWAGFYNSAIDGAFGRGTRGSMSAWQENNGFDVTGVLTTMQRAELLRQYNAVLDGMQMQTVTEARAGIRIQLPMGVVAFDRYEPPFVHYKSTNDIGARVLLISQPGDQNTLYGLYEIMQTLEIVPLDGERERTRKGFLLEGANSRIVSHTETVLKDGQIKGFTLIWPAGDEDRRSRILARMQDSFESVSGVLDPGAATGAEQTVDLVSGLRIRTPKMSRSGFYVDASGSVVTTAEAVQGCSRITLDGQYDATVVTSNSASGIAVLRPTGALAPMQVAALAQSAPRLQSEIAVSGYSFEGTLPAPTMTFGVLSDLRGLNGEDDIDRLDISALPGDSGGPVFDPAGAVMGMLLPKANGTRVLPAEVGFAADVSSLRAVLRQAGVSVQTSRATGTIAPEDLTNAATAMTVLVSCWD